MTLPPDSAFCASPASASVVMEAPLVSGTQRKRLHFGVPQNLPLPIVSAFSPQITPENTWMSNSVLQRTTRAAASGDGGNEHQPAVQCDESKLAGSTLWPAASRHISLRVLDGLSNYGLKWTTTSVVQHWPGQVHATHFMSRPPALSRQALAPLVHPVPGGGV
ncbi:hypothetical protein BDP67DRAFT_487521 [Colletotrichum lupini]|nr:hypothetical protein BDP67DRAFT_487521 [Colletotrichum lupini]